MRKIAIAIPSGDDVKANFAFALCGLVAHSFRNLQKTQIAIANKKGCLICLQRAALVEEALERGADYIFFLDSDMVFPPDTLERLLKHGFETSIVGCAYSTRCEPIHNTAQDANGDIVVKRDDKGLKDVRRLATGCMLIPRSVFVCTPRPWFLTPHVEVEGVVGGRYLGEDYYFCDKVRSQGFPIYADLDLSREVQHEGNARYDLVTDHG
ncbi:MAG TPA: glycosyltransferase [Sedimentisphaerales bacterium]|nr:glycosyltransferase [Sedimentisphaerales bacterium]